MISIPIIFPWNIYTPVVFRYLNKEHVDSFFNNGEIKLSSIEEFKQHLDEQRLDKKEGDTMFISRTTEGGGQTVTAKALHGSNAYILSASMKYEPELMSNFQTDSYIRIKDTTNFGISISKCIASLVSGFEGPCIYQINKIIESDLGYINIEKLRDPNDPTIKPEIILSNLLNSKMQHFPYFLKEKSFLHQMEYRFVWIVKEKVEKSIIIKVPEAIKFCEKPNALTE